MWFRQRFPEFVSTSLCVRAHTHIGMTHPRASTLSLLHGPTSPKPWVKCAMLRVRLCVCGKAKPLWHTKEGERCYLLSKLSLCLPYISAPKPPRLPITGRKRLVAEGEGVSNQIISPALILRQVKGIEGDKGEEKHFKQRQVNGKSKSNGMK